MFEISDSFICSRGCFPFAETDPPMSCTEYLADTPYPEPDLFRKHQRKSTTTYDRNKISNLRRSKLNPVLGTGSFDSSLS